MEHYPFQTSPEAVRDVHRLLQLLKRERSECLSPTDCEVLERKQQRVAELSALELLEILINNGPLFARCLVK